MRKIITAVSELVKTNDIEIKVKMSIKQLFCRLLMGSEEFSAQYYSYLLSNGARNQNKEFSFRHFQF